MGALACASYNHPLAPACTSLYLHYIQTGIAWQLISTASGTEETRRRAPQVVNLARNISGGHLGGRHLEEHQHHELLQRHLQPREGAGVLQNGGGAGGGACGLEASQCRRHPHRSATAWRRPSRRQCRVEPPGSPARGPSPRSIPSPPHRDRRRPWRARLRTRPTPRRDARLS